VKETFRKASSKVSQAAGSAYAFVIAFFIIVVWAITGPAFNFSDTWQLIINTGTTIGTFLMVFLIQNTQNRDSKAVQLKLDELIRATRARDAFVDLEDLSDAELAELDKEFKEIHAKQDRSHVMRKLHKSIEIENELRKSGVKRSTDKINELIKKITDY
jgi:low affinity Fe/Cu permease